MFMLKGKLEKQLQEVLEPTLNWLAVNPVDYVKILGGVYIAGGAITSTIEGKPPKDVDLFACSDDILKLLVNKYISGKLTSIAGKYKITLSSADDDLVKGLSVCKTEADINTINSGLAKLPNCPVRYVSQNAITFRNGLQLITRFAGEPEVVFNTFDYEHCKVYYKLSAVDSGHLVFCGQSAEAIATKTLIYNGNSRFVCSAVYRLSKFVRRGWTVSPQVFLRLLESATKINWSSLEAVKEELLGFYALTPAHVDYILEELKQKENFSIKEVTDLVEGL